MTKAEQFRENAEEAMQLCRQSRPEQAKKVRPHLEAGRGVEREDVCRSAGAKGLTTARSKPSATFKLSDRHLLAHYWRRGGI
jgi:hypothetical protein